VSLAEQIEEIARAIKALEENFVSPFFDSFSKAFMATTPPSQRRRWERDLARANRRPSLIHNGRKPR